MQTMEKDPIGNRIREIEEKYDLLKYQVDGWCIWHYFRPVIGADLLFKDEPLPQKDKIPILQRIKLALKGLPTLLFPGQANYFVVTCSSDRSEIVNLKRQNIIFDTLLKELNSHFIVESINNKNFIFPNEEVLIKSNLTTETLLLLGFFLSKLYVPQPIKKMAGELSYIIQKEFGLNQYTPGLVSDWCTYFYWLKKLYTWLIKRVNPKVIFVGSGGASYIFAAARELGIKVIEFQHGTLDHFNPVYSWSQYALTYKEHLPIPHHIFVSSDYVKNELMTFGFWKDTEVCPVGTVRVDEYRNRREENKRKENMGCQILLTTGTSSQKIIDFIAKFLHLTENKIKISLIIKTHPSYETNGLLYREAFGTDPRVQIIMGNEPPSTFELLSQSDVHLSICSSCHYDSLGLGTPTIILGLPCHEIFLSLYKKGHALLANTPEELYDVIRNIGEIKVPKEVSELYFKFGALKNIKSELMKLEMNPKQPFNECSKNSFDASK